MTAHKPIIPWMGGKRRLAKHLLPLLEADHRCYVEAFAGGASMLFYKPVSAVEVINDINADVVNLYRVVRHHLEEFVRQFKWALVSRQEFMWHQATRVETLTDIQRAARFYYLQKLAFGARPTGQTYGTATTSGPKLNLLRIEEELSQAHLRLSRVNIERLDWQECIRRYDRPHTLFYLDPPYWQTHGYGAGFGWEQYEAVVATMASMQGQAVLSINDHPDIRQVFSGFEIREVPINYTVGGGKGQPRTELIVANRR